MAGIPANDTAFDQELQRVLGSQALRNSEALRRLLAYLGTAYKGGSARDLKEYTIGRDAMGKPADYDPRVDASVRVQIGKLRQRLEQYYASEAPAAPLQIRLPKGHFELAVELRRPPPPQKRDYWRPATAILAVICAALTILVYSLWNAPSRGTAGADLAPSLREFWGPFLSSPRPLVLALGTPLFVRFNTDYFRAPAVNDWPEVERRLPIDELRKVLKSPTAPLESYRWTPFGEAAAAFRLATLLGGSKELFLKRSIVLAWEDVRVSNLIFLGPPKFNRQLRDLPVEQEFVIESGSVANLHPRPGEQDHYRKPSADYEENIPEDYAVVTRVRRIAGWGETLVLASTSTEGTWAAAEYVAGAASVREMMDRLKGPDGSLPDNYQVLLKSRFKAQVPIQTEYVTHRVLGPRSGEQPAR